MPEAEDAAGLQVRLSQDGPIHLDVSLQVAAGQILALVGPSGSGKSTTLRAIAGLYSGASGRIACNGRLWLDAATGFNVPARRRRVGLVFQSYALFPHLTALENIMQALSDRPKALRRIEAGAYLARVHLSGLDGRRPAELSGGQQQRVAVARALARRPEVLLLDEPFSAVDRMTRSRLQRELAELRQELSMPVILVTHDLEEAARLADRIAVMHRGSILQSGDLGEVTARPATPAVARLVGIHNIFDATVLAERTPAGQLMLGWRGVRLDTSVKRGFSPGEPVAWCIPAGSVIVHRRDRPSRGEHENPIPGRVQSVVRLGDTTELTIGPEPPSPHPIHCSVPTHVARRNTIEPGVAITVSLKADAIHIMRCQYEALEIARP